MKEGDEISLHVEAFASEGRCVTHIDGLAVFLREVVPGDEVRARVKKVKSQYAEASPLEFTRRSSLRTDPRCKYFGVCGGCKWQQVEYQAQLTSKRQQVVDALERIGGFGGILVNETLGSEDIYFYRNKMEFSFGDQWLRDDQFVAWKTQGENPRPFALGLHLPERFDKVLDIDECWLQSLQSNLIVNTVRRFAIDQQLPIYSTRTHEGYLRNLVIP
jgi:23S rRNA (uracil1939-C5)-methyltransferase